MTGLQNSQIPMPVWERLLKSCGLRRAELERLRLGDITQDDEEQIWLHVAESEESPARDVPIIDDRAILAILTGQFWLIEDELSEETRRRLRRRWKPIRFQEIIRKRATDDLLVSSLSPDLDFEQCRHEYAWYLYFGTIEALGVVEYPTTFNELGEQVRLALGLPKIDEMIRGFMRRAKRDFMREFKASV